MRLVYKVQLIEKPEILNLHVHVAEIDYIEVCKRSYKI